MKRFLKLKEQYQIRKTAHDSCELNTKIYDSMADSNPDLQPMALKAKSLTGSLKDELETIETEILELTKSKRNIEFKDPKYGKKSTYKSSISGILPTIEANSKRKIWNVWNRIADIIEENELNQLAGRDLFGSCLKCPNMIDYFELFSSNNLNGREIAIKLSQMYDTKSNKATYLSQYNSFTRSSTETVENAIERLKTILAGIEQHKRPGERKQDPEIYLRHHIKKMVTQKVWDQIEKEEAESLRDGRPMTINQMANRLDAIEERNMEKAMPDSMIQINSITRNIQGNTNSDISHSGNYNNSNKIQNQQRYPSTYQPNPFNQAYGRQNYYYRQNPNYPSPRQPYHYGNPSQRGNYYGNNRGRFNSNRGHYFNNDNPSRLYRNYNPTINSSIRESAEGRPPTPHPKESSSWHYENKKRSSDQESDRQAKRFHSSHRNTEVKSIINETNPHTPQQQGPENQPTSSHNYYKPQRSMIPRNDDNIWESNPGEEQWERDIASSKFQTPNYKSFPKYPQNNNWNNDQKSGQRERENATTNFGRGYHRNFRRGQNGKFRGRPFVKYVSRHQILYDQTCQNTDCQVPGQYVHHKDDCPKGTENNENKDFQ